MPSSFHIIAKFPGKCRSTEKNKYFLLVQNLQKTSFEAQDADCGKNYYDYAVAEMEFSLKANERFMKAENFLYQH